jgi:ABC-type Fe3+/spermidine/putrescine transport system ATPase subunit
MGIKEHGSVRFGPYAFAVEDLGNAKGETVYLAIRPENIELLGPDNMPDNLLPSNIVETSVEVVNFLGAVVRIAFMLEGEEMFVDVTEKDFEKISLKRRDGIKLYFPPKAFHAYSEIFKKLI